MWFVALCTLGTLWEPTAAAAQVGYPPESSPYHPVRARRVLSLLGGYLAGSAGKAMVGPTDGPMGGARFDLHLSGPAEMSFALNVASLNRRLIDPTKGTDDRLVGSAKQAVAVVDVGLSLLLTGEKSWRGLVPYAGLTTGLALGGSVTADSLSGFKFGTQFHVGPHLGIKWYPTDRLTFRVEGRDILWRLSYPEVFFSIPADDPSSPPVLDPAVEGDNQWTHHPTIMISLGYALWF